MLPDGKLYVPGAEKIIPKIRQLVAAAAKSHILIISSACAHLENDPEFQVFPPHCIKGTRGAEIVPEATLEGYQRIPADDPGFALPAGILDSRQVVIEKQVLDVFSNPNTALLVELIGAEAAYVVFGVVTEYCVRYACDGLLDRGRRVLLVQDAIQTLNLQEGSRALDHLRLRGTRLITTNEVLALL